MRPPSRRLRGPAAVGSRQPEREAMSISRRNWLKLTAGGGAGLALAELGFSASKVQAATGHLKLTGAKEFTTACNFCSCGCGMVCHVIDGKLVNLEGDPDHVINQGALCSKGAAMQATHESDRAREDADVPRARLGPLAGDLLGRGVREARPQGEGGPRLDLDRHREGRRRRVPGEPHRRDRLPGRRAEHERGVLPLEQDGPALRDELTSSTRPGFDTAPRSPVWGPRSAVAR